MAATAPAELVPPPDELRSMRGVKLFRERANRVPAPVWMQSGELEKYRQVWAYQLWSKARRDWCVEHGCDYVATFHPEWLERQ